MIEKSSRGQISPVYCTPLTRVGLIREHLARSGKLENRRRLVTPEGMNRKRGERVENTVPRNGTSSHSKSAHKAYLFKQIASITRLFL